MVIFVKELSSTRICYFVAATGRTSPEEPQPSCSSSSHSVRLPPRWNNYSRQSTQCADFVPLDGLYSFEEFLQIDPDSFSISSADHKYDPGFVNRAFDGDTLNSNPAVNNNNRFVGTYHRSGDQVNFYVVNDITNSSARLEDRSLTLSYPARPTTLNPDPPSHLNVSQLASQGTPDPAQSPDRIHPVIRKGLRACFSDALCCCYHHNNNMPGSCWQLFRDAWPWNRRNRESQYTVTEPEEPQVQRERPKLEDLQFKDLDGAVLIKHRGDVAGEQFLIDNCKDSVFLILDSTAAVTIDECENCVIILGPCKGSVFIRDTYNCTIFTACQQLRTRDSNIMIHLFCSSKPVIEDTKAQFFPLFLRYPFIEENLIESGLPPFTNHWSEVHDFTPDTSKFSINDKIKPLDELYAPPQEWIPILKAEKVATTEAESYFFHIPSTDTLDPQREDSVLIMYNISREATPEQTRMFHQTCWSICRRLTADTKLARLIKSYDLNLKEGEFGNILGQKKIKISGKLVVAELVGPKEQCRSFIENIIAPINYPNMNVVIVSKEQTPSYKKAINGLSEIQRNV